MIIKINDKEYNVKLAKTKEEKNKGLQGISSLNKDLGMLFVFDPSENVSFWMKDTSIPLDIIFINDDQEVIKVVLGLPFDETTISCKDVAYVLEVNVNSGILVGDELEFPEEDEGPVMKVLFADGSELFALWGGERIFSRKNTKVLIKKAKKADLSKDDKDYKSLGKYMFKCIETLDKRTPEYVSAPSPSK